MAGTEHTQARPVMKSLHFSLPRRVLGPDARLLKLKHDGAQARYVPPTTRPEVTEGRHASPLVAILGDAFRALG